MKLVISIIAMAAIWFWVTYTQSIALQPHADWKPTMGEVTGVTTQALASGRVYDGGAYVKYQFEVDGKTYKTILRPSAYCGYRVSQQIAALPGKHILVMYNPANPSESTAPEVGPYFTDLVCLNWGVAVAGIGLAILVSQAMQDMGRMDNTNSAPLTFTK